MLRPFVRRVRSLVPVVAPILALCAGLAAAPGCSGIISGSGDDDSGGGGDDDGGGGHHGTTAPDDFDPPPAPLALPDGAITAAGGRIHDLLAASPLSHSVLVVDETTGQTIASESAGALLTPASNTKLYTTAASMEILGEDHGMTTSALATAPIGPDGTLAGDLTVLSQNDFSLSSDLYGSPRAPLDRLAAQLRARGLRHVTGAVRLSGEAVYDAYELGTLNVSAERSQTTSALGAALGAAGITIDGGVTSSASLSPPDGAQVLVEHAPISLSVVESPLLVHSNNEMADMLIRHLGWEVQGDSSAAAGDRAVLDWLGSIGVDTTGISLNDGSGLSHGNKVSATSTSAVLAFMETSPAGADWWKSFSIAGVRGTIGNRLTGADTLGRVFAKTGTLSDTVALSGFLENRHDGQRYRFSILLNKVTSSSTARQLADAIVTAVAGDLRDGAAGARPAPPVLEHVLPTDTAGVLDIAWDPVDGADGYLVWLSDDGRVWSRDDARYVHATHFFAGDLSDAQPTYVRITARAAGGLESDASTTYAGTASDQPPDVLLVDANDRWQGQPSPENILVENHDFIARLAQATGGRRLASAHHGAVERGEVVLDGAPHVLWALGEQSVTQGALVPAARDLLSAYLAGGGAVIFSGSELVWALADQGSSEERAFSEDLLGADLVADDANTYEVLGAPGSALADLPLTSFLWPDGMDIMFPDVLAPVGDAQPLLSYTGGTGGTAALAVTTPGKRVAVFGFPIEAVPSGAARAALIDGALAVLDGP